MLVQTLNIAEDMLADNPDERTYSWESELDMYEMLHPDDHNIARMEKAGLCVQPPKQGSISQTQNPLHRAAMRGNKDLVAKLLACGWPVDGPDGSGETPLQLAFYRWHAPVVELLADRGANTDFRTTVGGTPLQFAEAANHIDLIWVLQLYKASSEVAMREANQHTSLSGSDPMAKDEFGKTALHWAAQGGSIDNLQKILENAQYQSVLIQDADENGLTPLHWAAKAGCFGSAIELLKFEAANTTIWQQDNFGKTPLHHSADKGAEDIVHLLLERRVSPEALIRLKDRNGKIPLHWAAQGDHIDVVRLLLDPKLPVQPFTWRRVVDRMLDDADDNGNTPVRLARRDAVVEVLRAAGGKGSDTLGAGA